jgi:hypothetical protein
MAFEESKLDFALERIKMLGEQFASVQACYDQEREERGRALELHMRSAENKSVETIDKAVDRLGQRLEEKIELVFRAMRAEADTELKSLVIDVGDLKQNVAELDVRTREVPLLRGRIEHLEIGPGQSALKAWQWMAAGGVSAAGVAFGIVSWILSH